VKNVLKLSLVFLFFVGVSLVYTAPLYKNMDKGFAYTSHPSAGNEVIPFQQGDPVQLYYHFWMMWDYVTGGPGPLFQDPYEFKVGKDSPGVFTTRRLLLSLVFLLFAPFGTVFAFNALILLAVALSGFMAFLLARYYTGKIMPSLVAGLIFAVFPFALGQSLGGHTNGFMLFLIPFVLLMFEKGFSSGKFSYFFYSSIGFASFALIEYHLLYYMCLLIPPFFLVRMYGLRPGWKSFTRSLIGVGVAVGIGVGIMLIIKSLEITGSTREHGVSFREIQLYSPVLRDFFIHQYRGMEKEIYLGWVVLGSAFLSFLFYGLKRPLFWFYAGIIGVMGLLCLGPTKEKFLSLYQLLYNYLPYFSFSRLPGRMVVFVALAAALLIALGLSRLKKGSLVASLALLGFIAIDYYPSSVAGITLLPPKSKVYEYVKENNGDKNLLCLPIWPGDTAWSSIYLYYVTQTKAPLVNGYYPVVPRDYVENVFYPLYSLNVGEVLPQQAELLKKLNVKYVVFHEEAFPRKVSHFPAHFTLAHLFNSPYLKLLTHDKKHWLFELLDKPRLVRVRSLKTLVGVHLMGTRLRSTKEFLVKHRIQILPAGKYSAIFNFSEMSASEVDIELWGNDPMKRKERDYVDLELLAKKRGKKREVKVPFVLDRAQLVTFQIKRPAKGEVKVKWILVTQKEALKLPEKLEAESLFTHGQIVLDPDASKGGAVYGDPHKLSQTELLFGPYREYQAGSYNVRFWIKSDMNNSDRILIKEPLASLEVVADFGKRILAKRDLFEQDLLNPTGYHPVEVSFTISEAEVLEFRVPYLREIGLYIDKVEIDRL